MVSGEIAAAGERVFAFCFQRRARTRCLVARAWREFSGRYKHICRRLACYVESPKRCSLGDSIVSGSARVPSCFHVRHGLPVVGYRSVFPVVELGNGFVAIHRGRVAGVALGFPCAVFAPAACLLFPR